MKRAKVLGLALAVAVLAGFMLFNVRAEEKPATSYAPVVMTESFEKTVAKMEAAKPEIEQRQAALLQERYDLSDRPAKGVTMSRGKPVQEGVRVKLPEGVKSWQDLAAMTPEEIRDKGLWPKGFLPLPHPNHAEGGMLFPKYHIDKIKQQEDRDLTRFDLDFDLPDHFLPEFPPPIYLTTRPDLGDVSQGQLVDAEQLLQAVQRHPEPEAIGRAAAAGDALPAAAVQRHRGPPLDQAEHGRGLLRLPRQRPHQRRDAPGRRHPPAGVPPPARHAVAARREHPAAVRLAAGAEERRGLHRVRAAGGLFRRRPGDRHQEGRQHPGTRAARSTSWPSSRSCSTSRPRRS